MDGYDSPRVQYASPRRQLSRSGKKNTIARDLDTRTPRYSPPPPATPPPASPARRSPSPEAPSYTRRRPSPPPFGSPDTLRSQNTVRTGGSAAAWERALHRRVAALEHQLKAEVAANDELRRRAAGDNVGDDDRSLAAAQAAWRRERRVLERQLHAARAAAADAVSRKPHAVMEDDESVDPAALVGRAADALDRASSLPSPVPKLRRKLKAWALRSAFSVASRVPYRAVARRFAFWRGAATVPPLLEGDDRTLRVVARVMRRVLKDWLRDATAAAFGDWVSVVHRSQGADWVTRVFATHFTRRGFRRWLRAAEASVQSRRLRELTNASDVSGKRQAHELAKYEKELREARARHAQELEKAEARRAEAIEECAAQFRQRNQEQLEEAEDRYQKLIDEAWQATERSRAQGVESVGAVTRHFANAALGRCFAQKPQRCRLVFFRRWAHNTRCDARWNVATRRLRRTIGRWSSRQKSEAWRTWVDVVEDERRRVERERDSARRLRATVGRWCERFLARAWRTWTDLVEYETLLAANEAASARRLRSALQHWRLRKTAKAWRAWTEAVEESARGDRRLALSARDLRLCVKRWVCRERAAAFRTWRRFLEIQRRLERCLRRCLNRHLSMSMSKWTSHCRFAKRALKNQAIAFDMMERCIGRLLHRSMGEAFDTWLSNAEALSAADALQEQSTYSLEKCLRKWLQRLTSRAFRTWTAESQRILHRKRAMLRASRRCVLLWVRGEVAAAFRKWSGRASRLMICADASMRIERIMRRALRRLVATARARAFASLREVALKSRALDHLATTRRLALEKCLRRWTKRSLSRGLETWATTTTFFHNLRRCVLRILRRRLATSFSTWSGESFRLRRRETVLRDAANGMRRCLTLWLRRKRARAYRKWSGHSSNFKLRSDAIKRLDRVRRRCLQRLRHATLLKALNTWIHGRDLYRFLEGHSIKATSALRRVLKRWLHREKAKALEAWFRTVFFIRGMERVVARIVHRLVAKAWVTWTGDVSAGLHRRALHLRGALDCQRCIQLWLQRKRARAFRKWSGRVLVLRGTAAAIRHLNRVRRRTIYRMQSADLSRAFWTWYDLYCERRALDLKGDERALTLLRVLGRWPRRAQSKAWRSWELRIRLLRQTERCVRRWRNKRHARAMRAWTEHVWERKSRRDALDGAARTLGVCVAAWSRKKVYGAFRTWSRRRVHLTRLTDAARRLHRIKSQSMRRLRFLQQGRGFTTWSRATHALRMLDSVHATHRHMLSRIVKKWILRTQSVAWRTWSRRVVLLRLLAKSVMRLVRREASRGLVKWISVLKRDKRAKAALRRVLTMWTKRRFTCAFRTWAGRLYLFRDRRQAAKRLQRIKASIINQIQQRSCSRALRTWRAYGSSCRALDRKLQRNVFTLKKVLRRWLNQTKAVGFKTWHKNSIWKRDFRRCVMRMLRFHLSQGFAVWAEGSFEIGVRGDAARRLRRKMFIVAKRIMHNKLHQAFVSWLLVLDEARDEEARKVEASSQMRRCVERWLTRGLRDAFDNWADAVVLRNDFERCVRRMLSRQLSAAFTTWSGVNFLHKLGRADRRGAANTMRRTLTLWHSRKKFSAFRKWSGRASFLSRRSRALQRTLLIKRKTFHRFRSQLCAKGFRTWVEHGLRRLVLQRSLIKQQQTARRVLRRWLKRHKSRAFQTWIMRVIFLRCLRRCLLRLLRRKLAVGFTTWSGRAFKLRDAQRRFSRRVFGVRRCLRRLMHRELATGLGTWARFVAQCKEKDIFENFKEIQDLRRHRQRLATFSKCVKAWTRRDRGSAFRTWVTTVVFLRNLGRCVSRMCHRQLLSEFTKWSGRSFALSRRRNLHDDASRRLTRNLQRWMRWKRNRAFLKWTAIIGATNLTKRVLLTATFVLRRWLLRQASIAFRTWHSLTMMETQSKQFAALWDSQTGRTRSSVVRRLKRSLVRWSKQRKSMAFNAWARCAFGDYHGDLLKWSGAALCRRALERRHRGIVHSKLLRWRRATFLVRNAEKHRAVLADAEARRHHSEGERKAHAAARLHRFLRSKRYGCLRLGFDAFEGHTHSLIEAQAHLTKVRSEALKRCALRWRRGSQREAFRILQGRHATLSKRQSACRRFRRTLGRFAAFQLSTSFQQWAKTSRGDARAEVILRRCLGRLANRAVGRACAAWWRVVFAVRRREELLERAASLLWRGGVTAAIIRWRRSVNLRTRLTRREASQRAALRLVARGLEGRLSTQASALKRHALNAWWSRVAKRGFVEQRLRTIATRVGAARTRTAFGTWRSHSLATEKLAFSQNHAAHAIKRVLGRWTKRLQAQAFEVLARRAATARFLIRIPMKMRRLKVASAFETWTGDVALLKSRKNAHKASVLRLRRVARRMARCLSYWLKRVQLRAFRTWVDLLSREVSKLYATKHVAFIVTRWRLRQISRALRTWRYTTGLTLQSEHFELLWRGSLGRGQDAAARQLQRCLTRWFSKKQTLGFRAWVSYVGDAACRQNSASLCLRICKKVAARASRRRLLLWKRASFLARNAEKHRAVLDDAALRRRHAVAERKGHACARLSRYLRSTMNGRVRRAWTDLKINAERGRSLLQQDAFLAHQRKHSLRRCVSYLRSGSKAIAFRAWCINSNVLRTKTSTLRRVLGRWTKRLQAGAFEVLARRVATARFLSRVLQKMLRLKALTAFTTWTTHIQRRLTSHRSLLSRARALRRCARVVKGGRLSLYFRAWASNIRRRVRTEAACRRIQRATTRYERATRLRYMRRWVQRVRDDKRASMILRKCLGRFAHRAVGRAAAKWWGDIIIERRREDLLTRATELLWRGSATSAILRWKCTVQIIGRSSAALQKLRRRRGVALRLLKRGLVGRTTRDAGNRLRRAWAAWRGRTRLLNALARRLARLAMAETRYRLRQAVRDWDRYAQAKILIELDDHGLNAVRFEEARANALRLRRQRSTVRHVANALLRPALARGFRAFRGHMMRMRCLAKVCQRAHMHARCTVQKAFFTMKAQRTRGDALSIVQASGRWVREAGARAMRVWLRRRARTFVLWAWRIWMLNINEQRLENQRRLTSNLNLVQGASRLERTLKRWRFTLMATCLRTWLDHASLLRHRHHRNQNTATAQIFRSLRRKWTQNAHRRLAAWRRAAFLLRNAEKHRLVLDEAEARRAFATTKRKAHAVTRLATWVRRWHDGKRARAFVRWCRYVLIHKESRLRGDLRSDCLRRCLQRGINRWAHHDTSKAFRAWRRYRDAFNDDVLRYGRQTATIRRLLAKHARRTTSYILRAWSQKARAEARAERILRRCLGRAAHRSLGAACSSWYDFLRFQEITETRAAKLARCVRKLRQPQQFRAFNRWRRILALSTQRSNAAARLERLERRIVRRLINARLGAAMDVWCAQRHKVSRAERARRRSVEALRKVLTRYASRDKRAAFRLFVDVTRLYQTQSRAARQLVRVFQRALRKQKAAHLATGLRRWRSYVVEARAADHRRDLRLLDLRKCVARFGRRSLAFAFLRWEACVEAQYRLRRLLSNCVLHKRKAAFRAWAEGVIERRDTSEAVRHLWHIHHRIFVKWSLRRQSCGFVAWRDVIRTHSNRTRALARVARRFSSYRRALAFRTWLRLAARSRRRAERLKRRSDSNDSLRARSLQLLRKVLVRYSRSAARLYFVQWALRVDARSRAVKLLTKCARRLAHLAVGKACYAWYDLIVADREQREALDAMCRCLRRFLHTRLWASWRKWMLGAHICMRRLHEARRIYLIRRKALRRFRSMAKARAFTTWRVDSERQRRVASKSLILSIKLKTPVDRWTHRKLYRSFGTWLELMLGLRNMARVLGRLGKHHLAMAFDAWSGHGFRLARKRDAATRIRRVRRRCVLRLQARQASRALRTWVSYVRACRLLERRLMRVERVLSKTVRRWVCRVKSAAFNKWRDCLVFLKHLERLVLRFVKRHLYIAFQTWSGRLLIIDQRRAAAKRLHRCQRRVLRHFYSVAAWMALQNWKQVCWELRAQDGRTASGLGIVERYVRRWLLHKIGRYLATWAATTMWLRNLERIVARLRRRRESIAFGTWSGERFRMERRNDILRRGLKAQRRWLRRLRHFAAQKAWRSWTALVSCGRENDRTRGVIRSILHKSVRKWVNRKVAKAFTTWSSNIVFLRNIYRVVKRLEHRFVAKAFDTWSLRNFALDKRVDSIRRVLVQKKRLLRHLCLRRCSRAFLVWRSRCLEGHILDKEQELGFYKLRKALRKWLRCKQMRAFETWCSLVEFKRNLSRVLMRFTKRKLAVGWRTWTDRNFRLVRRRDAMRRALKAKDRILRRMILKSCSKAWRTWQPHVVWDRAVAADRVLGLRCLRRCLSRWAKRDAAAAWRTWEAKARQTHLVRRCCSHFCKRRLALGYRAWAAHVTRRSKKEAAIVRLTRLATVTLRKWRRRGLAKGLRAWRGFVAECTALERKFATVVRALRAGLQRWATGRLKASFRRWHATVAFFDSLERCVLRMLRRRLAVGFQTLVSVVGLATKRQRAIHRLMRSKKRSIKHMQHRRLGRALRVLCLNGSSTSQSSKDKGTALSLLKRYARRWEGGQKHLAVRIWCRNAAARTSKGAAALRALHIGRRALRRLLRLRLAKSMTAWRSRTVDDKRAMGILTKVALRWKAGAVSRAYRRWALTARRFTARKVAMVQLARALMRCGARHRRNGLSAVLVAWRALCAMESDSDKDKRHAISVLARGAFKSKRLALIHGVRAWRAHALIMRDDATRARILHLLSNRCGRRVKRRAINQWRLKRTAPAKRALKRHVVARVSAVSRRQLFKAFVFWRSSAPRAAEDFWHANEYLRRAVRLRRPARCLLLAVAVTCVEVRNDASLKAALRSCVLRSAKTERGWLQLQACCFDTDGVYLGPSLATYTNGLTDEVLLDGGAAQVTGEGFCVDRVGRSSLPYVIPEGDAWVAAVDASLAHHALILRRLHGDPRCRRPSQRRASIKNFRESKPAFPPPAFEERALIPSNPQVASPREVAAGVLEVAQTGSSSRRTGLNSLIVKSGYLLYERLPGVWRRRFLKLRAVSFDVASRYAGPCVESSLDDDSEPLATFPLDSTRVRSGASEAGLHPMLFVDSASGASERFAAATRRDRDAWLQAVEAAREQHLTVVDSLRGEVRRPPPPPEDGEEPERTHLFRFGVNASKKFQCVHCSFRGTYDEVSVHERSCPDGGIKGILSCSARNWNQARYELKGGALVGDGQRFELRGASVRSAEPCGFDVEAPGRGPVSFVCATAVERDGWVRALSRVCRLATP